MADVCRVSARDARTARACQVQTSHKTRSNCGILSKTSPPAALLTALRPSVLSEVPLLMASIFPGRRTAISIPSERPQASGPPCLVIISGDDMGRRYELGHTEVTIGRTDECTICVTTDQVSRKHAAVQGILGKYFIVDLRSTNGTFVNEQKVERAKLL